MKNLTREEVAQLQKDLEAVLQKNGLTLTKNSASYSPAENSVTFRLGAVKISESVRGRKSDDGVTNEAVQNGFAPVGSRIQVYFKEHNEWFSGVILNHPRGRFDYSVLFDEGDRFRVMAVNCRKEKA